MRESTTPFPNLLCHGVGASRSGQGKTTVRAHVVLEDEEILDLLYNFTVEGSVEDQSAVVHVDLGVLSKGARFHSLSG